MTLAIGILTVVPLAYAAATSEVAPGSAKAITVPSGTSVTETVAIPLADELGNPPDTGVNGFQPGTVNGATHEAIAVGRVVMASSVLPAGRPTASWPLFAVMVGMALVLMVVPLIDTLAIHDRV